MNLSRMTFLILAVFLLVPGSIILGKEPVKKKSKTAPVDIGKVEVVVTATKTPHTLENVPVTTAVITEKDIESTNAQNVGQALRWLPGINIRTNGYSRATVKIHGLPSKYTLVLIDGQRLKGRHADSIDIGQVPVDMIDRIEVVKGPASVLYGSDAVAGVVNIITKAPPDRTIFDGYVSYGTEDTIRAMMTLGGSFGKFHYIVGGSKNKSENMGTGYAYDGYNGRGKFQLRFNDKNSLTLTTGYFNEEGDYLNDERYNFNLVWSSTAGRDGFLTVRGYYLRSNRLDARPGRDPRTWDESTARGEIQYVRLIGNKHLVTLGAESRYDQITYTLIEGTKSQRINSFYAQDEAMVSRNLDLVLAFRVDNHDLWGTVFVPKAGALINVGENTKIRTSVGKGFVAPSLSQLYEETYYHPWGGGFWLGGNPALKPEHSWGYNLEVEHMFTSNFGARISFFRNDLRDMITSEKTGEYINGIPVFKSVNVDKGMSQAIEMEITKNFGRNLSIVMGYTYLHTEISSTGHEFPYSPHHVFDVLLNYYNPSIGLSFNIAGKYLGKRYADTSNRQLLDEAYLLDLNISKEIHRGINLFVSIENLLNEKLEKESRYFRQGRTYSVGFRMHF